MDNKVVINEIVNDYAMWVGDSPYARHWIVKSRKFEIDYKGKRTVIEDDKASIKHTVEECIDIMAELSKMENSRKAIEMIINRINSRYKGRKCFIK